jgi:hypothetical protein
MDIRHRGEWVAANPASAAYIVASVAHSANTKVADSGMWLRQRLNLRDAVAATRANADAANDGPRVSSPYQWSIYRTPVEQRKVVSR